MIKTTDTEAKDAARLCAALPAESFARLLEEKCRKRILVSVFYDDFISCFWHYMSYHYGENTCGRL